MTVDEVRQRVERIQLIAVGTTWDNEAAHVAEDLLLIDVLTAIRDGDDSDDVAGLAREALRTLDIEFSRWCA